LEFIKEDRIKRFGFADSDKKKNKKISSVVHVNDFYDEKNFQITEIQSETSETEEEILAADTCLEKSVNNYGERTIADRILEKIGVVPIFIEELIQDLGEDAQIINATLMEMELDGIIKVKNGKVEKL
jgi:predicted Rossmann fold nucleotide-binding protein DprA/Smf involved in DNA uptake